MPNAYNVTVHYPSTNQEEIFSIDHVESVFKDDNFKQTFSVRVSGQFTDAFSELEPQNCIGSNGTITVKNSKHNV